MADIAPHNSPGPSPSFAEYTSSVAANVELVGRTADASRADTVAAEGAPSWSFGSRRAAGEAAQPDLPLAGAEAPARVIDRPQPMFGPVGRAQPAATVPLLAVVSLGAYAVAWHQRINRELEDFDPQLQVRPARSTVAVAIAWALGLVVTLAGAALVLVARLSLHLSFDTHISTTQAYYLLAGLAAVPYLVLLLPFSLGAVLMTLERLRCVEEHVATTTDRQVRPVRATMLLAIPLVGGLALLYLEQRRLNAIWAAVSPSGYQAR